MITLAGLSHHTAPLDVRERLAVSAERAPSLLRAARDRFGGGAALLATCNRLELYLGGAWSEDAVRGFLADEFGAVPRVIERHVRVQRDLDAVRHLYRVACGVDSMVLGETEVLGQVRAAFSVTVKAGTDDALISRLFHTALRTGRRARLETAISTRALSVASIAAQQARAVFPDLARASVLVIGAGEAGRLAAQAMQAHGARDVMVANRTLARADRLAAELGGRAVPFEDLRAALATAHVVTAASGSPEPVVSVDALREAVAHRDGEPLVIVDIGVPRDFEYGVRDLPGVAYYDLDDLRALADHNAEARTAEVEAVEAIVTEEAQRFAAWAASLQVQPTIAAIAKRIEATRREELAKTLRRLPVDDPRRSEFEELAEALTRGFAKQVMADPIHVLRARGDVNFTLEAARALFRLDPRLQA